VGGEGRREGGKGAQGGSSKDERGMGSSRRRKDLKRWRLKGRREGKEDNQARSSNCHQGAAINRAAGHGGEEELIKHVV
jgi:hypothetical protein